jgi:hypothetical protein
VRYDVNYLEDKAGDIPTSILPTTMEAYYTPYYVLTKIEGFFNQFSLIQIANLQNKRVSSLLNFFGNKVYYTGSSRELPAGIKEIPGLDLIFTGDTRSIAGLKSYRVEVHSEKEQFDVYYTEQIDIKKTNIITPYHEIVYPLSDFRIQLSYLKMHIICSEHERIWIESSAFSIPEEYNPVSRKTMEEIINSLFTKD